MKDNTVFVILIIATMGFPILALLIDKVFK